MSKPRDINVQDLELQMDDQSAYFVWRERDHMEFNERDIKRLKAWLEKALDYLEKRKP